MSSESELRYGKVAHRRRQREASSGPAPPTRAPPAPPGHLMPRVRGTRVATLSPHGRCGAASSTFYVAWSGEGTKAILNLSPDQELGKKIILPSRAPRESRSQPQTSHRRWTRRVHSGSAHWEGCGRLAGRGLDWPWGEAGRCRGGHPQGRGAGRVEGRSVRPGLSRASRPPGQRACPAVGACLGRGRRGRRRRTCGQQIFRSRRR